jgi:hypothetical protein
MQTKACPGNINLILFIFIFSLSFLTEQSKLMRSRTLSPLTKGLSISLSIYLSIYLSICISVCLSICVWFYSPFLDLGRFFSFLILYTVGRNPWTGDQFVARMLPTHITTQTQKKRIQISIRTHDPIVRESEDSLSLRPRGHI